MRRMTHGQDDHGALVVDVRGVPGLGAPTRDQGVEAGAEARGGHREEATQQVAGSPTKVRGIRGDPVSPVASIRSPVSDRICRIPRPKQV